MQPTFWETVRQQPNYLHLNPLNAHLAFGVRFATVFLYQKATPGRWHGTLLQGTAKVMAVVGYLFNTPLALLEGTLALGVGLTGTLLNAAIRGRSEFVQRYTIKTFAYSMQSFINIILQITLIINCNRYFVRHHTVNAALNQAAYLTSAVATQLTIGSLFDQSVQNRQPNDAMPPAFLRTCYMLVQQFPFAFNELCRGLERDFNYVSSDIMQQDRVRSFMDAFPQYRATLQNLNISRLAQASYRQELSAMAIAFLRHSQLVRTEAQNPAELVLNNNQAQDTAYQNHLFNCVKESVKELYRQPTLVACLGESVESGREALEGFDAEVYIPLAHYSQLKELEAPLLTCPATFSNQELRGDCPNRRTKLEAARNLLLTLSPDAKNLLIQKLLKGASFEVQAGDLQTQEKIRQLFVSIGELAGSLHQGRLMNQTIVNVTNINQPFNTQNLFHKAYQEAIREVTSR